jgi:hypothetical protein
MHLPAMPPRARKRSNGSPAQRNSVIATGHFTAQGKQAAVERAPMAIAPLDIDDRLSFRGPFFVTAPYDERQSFFA